MRDDFYSPAWAENRRHIGAMIGRGFHKLAKDLKSAFDSLARRNYDAPWLAVRTRDGARHH